MVLDRLIPSGKYYLAAFMVLCVVEHLIYDDFVASLVPAWIWWHFFWTYFAGMALIAGWHGIVIPITARPAALLSGMMIPSWVPLVHIPLALQDVRQLTPVFEALAFGSAGILAAMSYLAWAT